MGIFEAPRQASHQLTSIDSSSTTSQLTSAGPRQELFKSNTRPTICHTFRPIRFTRESDAVVRGVKGTRFVLNATDTFGELVFREIKRLNQSPFKTRQCKHKPWQLVLQRQPPHWSSQLHRLQRRRHNSQVQIVPDLLYSVLTLLQFTVLYRFAVLCTYLVMTQDFCLAATFLGCRSFLQRAARRGKYDAWSFQVRENLLFVAVYFKKIIQALI